MTQKDQILFFFSTNPTMEYTPTDISKQFPKFAKSSVRRVLQELLADNKLIRETRGHYNINDEIIEKIYRKILKVGASCKKKQVLLYAVTFEFNDIDREDELLEELKSDFPECTLIIDDDTDLVRNVDNWGKQRTYKERGYASEVWDRSVKVDEFFTNIRTGRE